jgi:hypothetical protein
MLTTPAMQINAIRPAHNATVLVSERRASQCGQTLALVLMSSLHSGHFFIVIAQPSHVSGIAYSFRLGVPPEPLVKDHAVS